MSTFRRMLISQGAANKFKAILVLDSLNSRTTDAGGATFANNSILLLLIPQVDNQEFKITVTDRQTGKLIYSGTQNYKIRTQTELENYKSTNPYPLNFSTFETENKFDIVVKITAGEESDMPKWYTAINIIDEITFPYYFDITISSPKGYTLYTRAVGSASSKNNVTSYANQLYKVIEQPKNVNIDEDLWHSSAIK